MIWGFVQFLLWMWVYAICGGITLCLGVLLLDVEVDSVTETLVIILLWPLFFACLLINGILHLGITLYFLFRKKRAV